MAELSDAITFLGTAGARFVVARQFLASGGAWLSLGNTQILLDPGPGSLVQATRRKLDPTKLEAIILSHRHLDHSGDINIMIEAMTYGFIFQTPRHTFSWIIDTRYFEDLAKHYEGDLLVINVVRLNPGAPIDHLSLPEAKSIIEELKPKIAILTHFGMTMWRAKPWELAKKLGEETGISVIAARDGMKFDLAQLE